MTNHVGDHDDRTPEGADEQNWEEAGGQPETSVAAPTAEASSDVGEKSSTAVSLGKGLDVGTANLVSAVQNDSGGITIKMERNAFIDIQQDVHSKNLLTKLKVPYVIHNNTMIVLGDEAFQLANIFNRTTRRPMKDGMISPAEVDAMTDYMAAIQAGMPFAVVTNAAALACGNADAVEGEASPGCVVELKKGAQAYAAAMDGLRWGVAPAHQPPFDVVVTRQDRINTVAFPVRRSDR